MNVILSIKPKYADAIFSGIKGVEFRKTLFKQDVSKVLVYSSSPVKKIIGYFTIAKIVKDSPEGLWERFRDVGGIRESDFFQYFENRTTGYSIVIEAANLFDTPLDPYEEIDNFVAPQSFRYCDGCLIEASSGEVNSYSKEIAAL